MDAQIVRWTMGLEIGDWSENKIEVPEFCIDRPAGSGDFLFLHFRTPVELEGFGIVEEGNCLIFSPRAPQKYGGVQNRAWANDYIHFRAPDFPFWPVNQPFLPKSTVEIGPCLAHIGREITGRAAGHQSGARFHLALLFLDLMRAHPWPDIPNQGVAVEESFAVLRAEIYAAPQKSWTIALLARRVHLSPSRFCVRYKAAFGVSAIDDVLSARLQKARTLLTNQNASITQVARECGFGGAPYFSRIFKAREGCAPRDWYRARTQTES